MAINPFLQFPGKTAGTSAPWPYGEPRDVSSPGAGDGWPWNVAVCKDIAGMQQALLEAAGITPSNVPETAATSQYLEALSTIFDRSADATTDILTSDLAGVSGIVTRGYAAANDEGAAVWIYTSGSGAPGSTDFANGLIYDSTGREFALAPGPINPRQYGAVGDGVTNDRNAFQNALDTVDGRGGGIVHADAGTYFLDAQITVSDKTIFRGDGRGATVLDYTGATGSFPNAACLYSVGAFAALPALSVDVSPVQQLITFSAVHGLAVGDLFIVTDPRSYSYSRLSSLYKAGEFMVVAEVPSTTTVVVETPAFATTNPLVNLSATTYDATQCDVWKITPTRFTLEDLTIQGQGGATSYADVRVLFGQNCSIKRVDASGKGTNGGTPLVYLWLCYGCEVSDVGMISTTASDYGLLLAYCQQIFITRVSGGSAYNSIDVGLLSSGVSVVNRQIHITDCFNTRQRFTLGSIRLVTNCEHITVSDSTVAGMRVSGDRHTFSNVRVQSQPTNQNLGLFITQLTGSSLRFSDCEFLAVDDITTSEAIVFSKDAAVSIDRPGVCEFNDCLFDSQGHSSILFWWETAETSNYPSLRLNNCRFVGANIAAREVRVLTAASGGWELVEMNNCRLEQAGVEMQGAHYFNCTNTEVFDSPEEGFFVKNPTTSPHASRYVNFHSCRVRSAYNAGIYIADEEAGVQVFDTVSLNNNTNASKASTRSSFVFEPASAGGATTLLLANCVFGDDQSVATQTYSYHYNNVDDVIDSNTTILGTLPVTRTSVTAEAFAAVWDSRDTVDQSLYTGSIGLKRATPSAAPSGAQDIAIGTGSGDRGIALKSSATGTSSLVFGDGSDDSRFKIAGYNTSGARQLRFTSESVAMCSMESDGIHPYTANVGQLGRSVKQWEESHVRHTLTRRLYMSYGTPVVIGDFVLHANWGTGASVTAVRGRDSCFQIFITSGSGAIVANPTVIYTYKDGATANNNLPFIQLTGAGPTTSEWHSVYETNVTAQFRFIGTPATSTAYELNGVMVFDDL